MNEKSREKVYREKEKYLGYLCVQMVVCEVVELINKRFFVSASHRVLISYQGN